MKINKPSFLPEHIKWHSADNSEQLTTNLCKYITCLLANNKPKSLAVSGGNTPLRLFQQLSNTQLDWNNIDLTLVDDRWLEPTHKDSNERLVRENLLQNKAKNANFIALKNQAPTAKDGKNECEKNLQKLKQPINVILLGMGNDGHTASLFPCSKELQNAMQTNNICIATTPTTAPYERITLSFNTIDNAKNKILHIVGKDKLITIETAINLKNANKMPIYHFLQKPLSIYWSM